MEMGAKLVSSKADNSVGRLASILDDKRHLVALRPSLFGLICYGLVCFVLFCFGCSSLGACASRKARKRAS